MGKKYLKYRLKYYKDKTRSVKTKKIIILLFVILITFVFIFFFLNLFVKSKFSFKIFHVNEKKIFQNLKVLYFSGNYEELSYNIDNLLRNKIVRSKKGLKNIILIKLFLSNLNNDYDQSAIILKKYKKYFSNSEFSFLFSFMLFKKGDMNSAAKYLGSVLNKQKKYNNEWKKNYLLYSYLKYIQNDVPEAIVVLNKIKNKDEKINYNLAFLYFLDNKKEEALKILYNISNSEDLELDIKINLLTARLLNTLGNYYESNIYLNKIKDSGIDYDTYYYNFLLNSFYNNDSKKIRNYYKLIKNVKFFYKLYSLLFVASYSINDFENAKSIYEKYISQEIQKKIDTDKFDDIDLINYLIYIDILINDKLDNIAISYIEKILKLNFNRENTLKIYKIYISLLIKENYLEKAKNVILKNKNFLFSDKMFIKILLDIYIKQNRFEDGITFVRMYFNPQNDTFDFYYLQGYLYRKMGYFKRSNEILLNLLDILTDIREKDIIYKTIAKNFIDLKNYKDAENILNKFKNKNDNEYLKLCLKNYFYLEDWDNLIITGKRILLTEKNKSLFYFYIGYGYYKRKDFKQAIYYFKNSLEIAENKKLKAIIAIYIGNSYGYLEDYENSLFYYNEAKTIDSSNLYSEINIEKLNQGEKNGK